MTLFTNKAPANFVPAAAVIREALVLFGITGHKGSVDGIISLLLNILKLNF